MILCIVGPTGVGKTKMSVELAKKYDAIIINCDAMQVYKGLDIGTAKVTEEEKEGVEHYLFDFVDPKINYTVFDYQKDARALLEKYKDRNIIFVGGTGLYIESVLKGYRLVPVPENKELRESLSGKSLEELADILSKYKKLHNSTDIDTAKRAIRAIEIEDYYQKNEVDARQFPHFNSLIIGVDISRELRREKISKRLRQRLDEGMVDEVRSLLNSGLTPDDLIYYGLEYKYLTLYVTGALTFDEMCSQLEVAIHQFAKRQMTWFRGMERRGFTISWINAEWDLQHKIDVIQSML